MKIKMDFVTNSSSTCFVIIVDEELKFDEFINVIGIKNDSSFKDIYESLFYAFKSNMEPAREFINTCRWRQEGESVEDFISRMYAPKTLEKFKEAEQKGKKVFMGWLSSDNNEIETFFCTDYFIIESKNIYIDYSVDGW